MLEPGWRFSTFRSRIAKLSVRRYEREDLCGPAFALCRSGPLEAFYAPLDWVNREAKLVLLSAAPGWHEMETAFRTVRAGLDGPGGDRDLLRRARLAVRPPSALRQRLLGVLQAASVPARCGLGA